MSSNRLSAISASARMISMSDSIVWRILGRRTLRMTSVPSLSTARCACPTEAAANES
jgi:hypothetical protein